MNLNELKKECHSLFWSRVKDDTTIADTIDEIVHHVVDSIPALIEGSSASPATEDSEGWIPWYGGDSSAVPYDRVDVILADGMRSNNRRVEDLLWGNELGIGTIVEYRKAR